VWYAEKDEQVLKSKWMQTVEREISDSDYNFAVEQIERVAQPMFTENDHPGRFFGRPFSWTSSTSDRQMVAIMRASESILTFEIAVRFVDEIPLGFVLVVMHTYVQTYSGMVPGTTRFFWELTTYSSAKKLVAYKCT
jgi:hypothetical protein